MKFLFVCLFSTITITDLFSQDPAAGCRILSDSAVSRLLTDSLKQELQLMDPIRRVYSYVDKSGQHYCILTQSLDFITPQGDTLHYNIRAVNMQSEGHTLLKTWELNDKLENTGYEEYTIGFLTGYMDFKDIDGDSLIDPVIVYGALGLNEYEDSRIKIIVFYKDRKITIRHQNSELDEGRETKVDPAFYDLPLSLQEAIKKKMQAMVNDKISLFPTGWENAMKNRKLIFNDRH